MNVELGNRLEAYVKFAWFCRSHNVEPKAVAEVIAIDRMLQQHQSSDKRRVLRNEIAHRLHDLGFTNIGASVIDGKTTFRDKNDDQCHLPKIV